MRKKEKIRRVSLVVGFWGIVAIGVLSCAEAVLADPPYGLTGPQPPLSVDDGVADEGGESPGPCDMVWRLICEGEPPDAWCHWECVSDCKQPGVEPSTGGCPPWTEPDPQDRLAGLDPGPVTPAPYEDGGETSMWGPDDLTAEGAEGMGWCPPECEEVWAQVCRCWDDGCACWWELQCICSSAPLPPQRSDPHPLPPPWNPDPHPAPPVEACCACPTEYPLPLSSGDSATESEPEPLSGDTGCTACCFGWGDPVCDCQQDVCYCDRHPEPPDSIEVAPIEDNGG